MKRQGPYLQNRILTKDLLEDGMGVVGGRDPSKPRGRASLAASEGLGHRMIRHFTIFVTDIPPTRPNAMH